MKDWEITYLQTRPIMGSPDDTDDGHALAEAEARLKWARLALRWYEEERIDKQIFFERLHSALDHASD